MIKYAKQILHSLRGNKNLKKAKIEDVFPGFGVSTVKIFHPSTTPTGCRLIELILFGYLAQASDNIHFFEIGTSEGRTARNIAINLRENGRLSTIDLPTDAYVAAEKMPEFQRNEFNIANAKFLYELPPDTKKKITLLYGDSTKYNFQEHYQKYDFIFVDGNHATQAILDDAKTAKLLLRSEGGVILFHDYLPDSMPTVEKAISVINKSSPMLWLEGTKLAVAVFGEPRVKVNSEKFQKAEK